MSDYMTTVKAFETEFQDRSGLKDRRYYKIQYSHLHPFPLLALGDNPGGVPESGELLESSTFYENGKHDIVEYKSNPKYHIASGMFALLAASMGTPDADAVRQVPYLNVTFRRSQSKASLNINQAEAARESAPVLANIIRLVDPSFVVITNGAFSHFRKLHLTSVARLGEDTITTPNGKHHATIFEAYRGTLSATGREVVVAVVGHPSVYSRRTDTWAAVARATAGLFDSNGLRDALKKYPR